MENQAGVSSDNIEGVIGLIMDVTELRAIEQDLILQATEKKQLVANEAAAKEASRLKSQFLANVRFALVPAEKQLGKLGR